MVPRRLHQRPGQRATLIAFYRLGASAGQRRTVGVTAVAVLALLIDMVLISNSTVTAALTAAGYVLMAVLFGQLIRHRRLLVDQLAERAQRAEANAERRVVQERLRIARDIHDVLAHTVSAMTVQAEVAADALDRDPAAVRAAMGAIRQAGKEAMAEVRATVAVLRSGGDPADTAPAPRIAGVGGLAATAREHGIDVWLDVTSAEPALPGMVELTAFRVVQEALTNVVRHADAGSVRVTIREEEATLLVEVRDDGAARPPDPATAGLGLRGMAERVESIGGQLWHGRDQGGGWVVRARLPLAVPVR